MRPFIFAFFALCFSACVFQTAAQVKLNGRVGVVNSMADNRVCLAIANKKLSKGQSIGIIFSDKPQTYRSAKVLSKASESCSSEIDVNEGVSFYFLQVKPLDHPWVEIGVVGLKKPRLSNGRLISDINGDGKSEYFRTCTSNEGVHLTVWNGLPLRSKRIWHAYYYLKYDTESTCKKKDYAGT